MPPLVGVEHILWETIQREFPREVVKTLNTTNAP